MFAAGVWHLRCSFGGVTCRDVAFRYGRCRIDIAPDPEAAGEPLYIATMFFIEEATGHLRPLMFDAGIRAVLRAPGEALALSLALGYLETRFGLFLTSVPSVPLGDAGEIGDPIVVDSPSTARSAASASLL